jgi:hypothetical protein
VISTNYEAPHCATFSILLFQSLPQFIWIQSPPPGLFSLRHASELSYHLRLLLAFRPSNLNSVRTSHLPHACYMLRPYYYPPCSDHPNNTWWKAQIMEPLITPVGSFLQPPVTASLLRANIPLSTAVPNTLSLHSSLAVRDQVSSPYKSTDKNYNSVQVILLILTFFYISDWKTKDSELHSSKYPPNFVCSYFPYKYSWFVSVVHACLNFATSQITC